MQSHLTSASTTFVARPSGKDEAAEALAHPLITGDRARMVQEAHARPRLTLASAPVWKHKLVLTGTLDHRSVVELEDEIECLCEEGVTILTLDLRQLDAIDSVGATAIACGGVACKERGCDLAVVPGSPVARRTLAEAGAESLFAEGSGETGVLATSAAGISRRDTSTTMVKSL